MYACCLAIASLVVPACSPLAQETQTPPAGASPTVRFEPAAGSPVRVGSIAGLPVLGDLDGDGDLDFVVGACKRRGDHPDRDNGQVIVMLNDGHGSFARRSGSYASGGANVPKVALGDFDGDGDLDVAAVDHDSYLVTLLANDGHGALSPAPTSPVKTSDGKRPHTHDVAAGDVDGDGRPDLVTTNADDGNVSVLLNRGGARFEPAPGSPFPAGRHPYDGIVLADFDRDGKLDIAVPDLRGNQAVVLAGSGDGRFPKIVSQTGVGPRPGFLAAGDFDGDGNPDLVATHDDDALVAVLKGDGKGGFAHANGSPIALKDTVWGIAIGDVDGDRDLDVVLGSHTTAVTLLIGDGHGKFRVMENAIASEGTAPSYPALADVDGDGRLDLITGNYESGDVSILLAR
jgi:hypothetical protein